MLSFIVLKMKKFKNGAIQNLTQSIHFRGTKQDYDMELPVMQIVQVT